MTGLATYRRGVIGKRHEPAPGVGYKGAAFGQNNHYEHGSGSKGSNEIEGILATNIVQFAPFLFCTAVLLADETVWLAGNNQHAQGCVGVWQTPFFAFPQKTLLPPEVIALAACHDHPIALLKSGQIRTWGTNGKGLLGIGTEAESASEGTKNYEENATTPQTPLYEGSPLAGIVSIAAGDNHNLALDSAGVVYGWGSGSSGAIGQSFLGPDQLTPGVVAEMPANVVAIAAGGSHSLLMTSTGKVYGLGLNQSGQLGNGETKAKEPVTLVPGITTAVAIAAGASRSFIKLASGAVLSCGSNKDGQLGWGGVEDNEDHPTFQETLVPHTSTYIFAAPLDSLEKTGSSYAICAGKLYSWGNNRFNTLGRGATGKGVYDSTPGEVPLPSACISVAGSEYSAEALLAGAAPAVPITWTLTAGGTKLKAKWNHTDTPPGSEWQALVAEEDEVEIVEEEEIVTPGESETIKLGETAQEANLTLEADKGYQITIRQTGAASTWDSRVIDTATIGGFKPFVLETKAQGAIGPFPEAFRYPQDPFENKVANPSFEYAGVGTTGWTGSGATLTRITSQHFSGSAALQIKTTGSGGSAKTTVTTPEKPRLHYASIYLKGASGSEKVKLVLGNGSDTDETKTTLTTSWQRVEVNWKAKSGSTFTTADLSVVSEAGSSITVYADAAQVERSKETSPYADGDTARYNWAGTAGNSETETDPAPKQGDELLALSGLWGRQTLEYSYEWYRDKAPMSPKVTGHEYTVKAADVGHVLSIVVTATNPSDTTVLESVASTTVVA